MKLVAGYEFRPGLWPTVVTLLVFPLLLSLGFWQLDRAEQKAGMQADFQARYDKPTVALSELMAEHDADDLHWRRVTVRGHYAGQSFLLDNQVHGGDVGYRLYTPLKLAGRDRAVLVERDWLPQGPDRSHVPDVGVPDNEVHLQGRIVPVPATGIMLAEHRIEALNEDLFRVQRIQPQELSAHSGLKLLPYIVRHDDARHAQDDEAAALGGFGRERHLGYAFQWFALAATLLIIYVCVNIKRTRRDNEQDN